MKRLYLIIVLFFALCFFANAQNYIFQYQLDQLGNTGNELAYTNGVATDYKNNVYIADAGLNSIRVFDSSGTYLFTWGNGSSSGASVNGLFRSPAGIATVPKGQGTKVYVADKDNHRIQVFYANGNAGLYESKWGTPITGGSDPGQFNHPSGIAIDTLGDVYVADTDNHRIQKFSSDGIFIIEWGYYGTGPGEFAYPFAIAIDKDQNVLVSDGSRIQKFTSTGTYITQWGSFGTGDGQFTYTGGIAVDTSGNIYVTDHYGNRIQKFTSSGTFITKWGTTGAGNGQFNYPNGVAVDLSGKVYVSNGNNFRVEVFAPDLQTYVETQNILITSSIYPNPSSEFSVLQISSDENIDDLLSVYDVFGQKVFSEKVRLIKGQNQIPLPVQTLANGIYFIRLSSCILQNAETLIVQK